MNGLKIPMGWRPVQRAIKRSKTLKNKKATQTGGLSSSVSLSGA